MLQKSTSYSLGRQVKILSISPRNVDFYNFRRDTALQLKNRFNHEVVVACETTVSEQDSRFRFREISFKRGSLNPLRILWEVSQLRRVFKEEKPDVYIAYTFKVALISSFAAWGLRLGRIHTLTGMGYSFASNSFKARLLRTIASRLARLFFYNHHLIVLNRADFALVKRLGFSKNVRLISGEGIDPKRFDVRPEPSGEFQITFVGRLLRDKGIMKLVAVGERLIQKSYPFKINIYGSRDPQNPESLTQEEFTRLSNCKFVKMHGFSRDVNEIWAQSHVCILLSEREGLPQALLEAMATKRVIVTSDIEACRDLISNGHDGYLVDRNNLDQIADRLTELHQEPAKRHHFAECAYAKLLAQYSAVIIAMQYQAILSELGVRPSKL